MVSKKVIVEAWSNTTFALREESETPGSTPPVPEDLLKDLGKNLKKPRIKLVLSPQKAAGVYLSKEQSLPTESEGYFEIAQELSKKMKEILGNQEITAEVEFAKHADTDICVEFDCETNPNASLPQEIREYLAESVLQILDAGKLTKEGSAEVWIRQGHPENYIFN